MRQVRVQGCLPTLAVLLVIAALGAVAFTAGLAVVLVTTGLLLVLWVVRAVRRLLGGAPVAHGPGGGRPSGVEAVPPGWMAQEGGPVVEAGPRAPEPPAGPEGDPHRAGERELPPRG
ncbi:MAG: hypothetical protein NDI82_08425 [Anaeromyxobacteraceae bacterium]|nr:hypothetical protein [Anaeromyxobacteraceae bacterium]